MSFIASCLTTPLLWFKRLRYRWADRPGADAGRVLDLLDPRVTYETICKMAGPDAILVCWEGPTKFCHRQLVAQWFEDEIGCKIPELV